MSVAPSTTWLLVSTSPFDVITMPLPFATPEPTLAVMFTMPGLTAAATAETFVDPEELPDPEDLPEPEAPDDPEDRGVCPPNGPAAGGAVAAVDDDDDDASRPTT